MQLALLKHATMSCIVFDSYFHIGLDSKECYSISTLMNACKAQSLLSATQPPRAITEKFKNNGIEAIVLLECESTETDPLFSVYKENGSGGNFTCNYTESCGSEILRWNGHPNMMTLKSSRHLIFGGRKMDGQPVIVELTMESNQPLTITNIIHLDTDVNALF